MKEGVSDWEELSQEDYKLIKENMFRLNDQLNEHDVRFVLIEKDDTPVQTRISSIKSWLEQVKAKEQAEMALKKAKAEKRARKKLLKNAESEIKLLEELKKKYPNAV